MKLGPQQGIFLNRHHFLWELGPQHLMKGIFLDHHQSLPERTAKAKTRKSIYLKLLVFAKKYIIYKIKILTEDWRRVDLGSIKANLSEPSLALSESASFSLGTWTAAPYEGNISGSPSVTSRTNSEG